jgi:ABC-type nitrate/sulfonate/bicarbonate transport system ATPase subunit
MKRATAHHVMVAKQDQAIFRLTGIGYNAQNQISGGKAHSRSLAKALLTNGQCLLLL